MQIILLSLLANCAFTIRAMEVEAVGLVVRTNSGRNIGVNQYNIKHSPKKIADYKDYPGYSSTESVSPIFSRPEQILMAKLKDEFKMKKNEKKEKNN